MRYFWHDLRKEQKIFSKRQFGGGSLMIWGAFVNGTIFELHIMNGIVDSVKYTDMLGECLDPFMRPDWIFMLCLQTDDNSPPKKNWRLKF